MAASSEDHGYHFASHALAACRLDLCSDDVIAQFTQINRYQALLSTQSCCALSPCMLRLVPRTALVKFAPLVGPVVCRQSGRNFANFGSALLLLFRMATGENWNLVMQDGMKMISPGIAVAYASI